LNLSLTMLVSLIACLGLTWSGASLLIVLRDRSVALTISDAYRLGWAKFWPLIWVSILAGFIIGGGLILFVIPGVILIVWLMFSKIIAVVEDETGMKAIVKSREYVRDYFWPVLGRFIIIVIALIIIYAFLLTIVSALLGSLVSLSSTAGAVIFILLSALVNILVTPVAMIAIYLVYENLKKVKGEIITDSVKKQTFWYLMIGLAGWVLVFVVCFFFLSLIISLLAGFFLGQVISGLGLPMIADLSTTTAPVTPTSLPAQLTPDQAQQLQAQLKAVQRALDKLKQGQ
ncbi:MAG: hypothetical protein NT041_01285, partial [Candidatus Vogelbacteria bacterium]|nr:hypothetical protein [Candidatus Vogelbacteria bacterium]